MLARFHLGCGGGCGGGCGSVAVRAGVPLRRCRGGADDGLLHQVVCGAAFVEKPRLGRWRPPAQGAQRRLGRELRPVLECAHLQQMAVDAQQFVLVNRNGRNAEHRHFARHRAAGADEQIAVRRDIGYVERPGVTRTPSNLSPPVMVALPCPAAARPSRPGPSSQHECVEKIATAFVVLGGPWFRSNVHHPAWTGPRAAAIGSLGEAVRPVAKGRCLP